MIRRGVLDRAQIGDRRVTFVGGRQATWPGTGCEQQLVVALRTTVGCQCPAWWVDSSHCGAQSQIDVAVAVPLEPLNGGGLEVIVSHQVALGQRRPLIGRVSLRAVEHDVSFEAALAEFLHGPAGSQSGADDRECLPGDHAHHPCPRRTGEGNSAPEDGSVRSVPKRAEATVRAPGALTPRRARGGVLGLDHDADATRRGVVGRVLSDLLGQPLLCLGAVAVEVVARGVGEHGEGAAAAEQLSVGVGAIRRGASVIPLDSSGCPQATSKSPAALSPTTRSMPAVLWVTAGRQANSGAGLLVSVASARPRWWLITPAWTYWARSRSRGGGAPADSGRPALPARGRRLGGRSRAGRCRSSHRC